MSQSAPALKSITVKIVVFRGKGRDQEVLIVHNLEKPPREGEKRGKPAGWGLPGGGVKAGEDPHEAALFEFFEETGLVCDTLDVLPVIRDPRGENHEVWVYRGERARRPSAKEIRAIIALAAEVGKSGGDPRNYKSWEYRLRWLEEDESFNGARGKVVETDEPNTDDPEFNVNRAEWVLVINLRADTYKSDPATGRPIPVYRKDREFIRKFADVR